MPVSASRIRKLAVSTSCFWYIYSSMFIMCKKTCHLTERLMWKNRQNQYAMWESRSPNLVSSSSHLALYAIHELSSHSMPLVFQTRKFCSGLSYSKGLSEQIPIQDALETNAKHTSQALEPGGRKHHKQSTSGNASLGVVIIFSLVLGIKSRASYKLSKCSTIELQSKPL